jgi:hypothetical protein
MWKCRVTSSSAVVVVEWKAVPRPAEAMRTSILVTPCSWRLLYRDLVALSISEAEEAEISRGATMRVLLSAVGSALREDAEAEGRSVPITVVCGRRRRAAVRA